MPRRCTSIPSSSKWCRSFSHQALHWTPLESAYRELGLPAHASPSEVKEAFRRRALQCHPDLHPNDGKEFMRVTAAYERIMQRGIPLRRVVSPSPHAETRIFHGPVAFWWISLLLGTILFWYPSQMYLSGRSPRKEPTRVVEPSRDAVKRERIAAILFERQRKQKDQNETGCNH